MPRKNSLASSGQRSGSRGLTLIELMIALAVVALLASIALPSYQDQVRKSRRADTQAFLSEVVARQQHFLLDRRAYATSVTAATTVNGLGMTVPASVSSHYTVTLVTDNAARPPIYTLTAAPNTRQAGDACGSLFINQAGTKTAAGKGTCW